MESVSGIVLAHSPPFRLGAVEVRPATRELVGPAGREMVEPRVMQVLVALAGASGEVVARDDLIRSCWDGRIVGEDSISRVISRIRRLSETIGAGSFRLETITKVGYRLLSDSKASDTIGLAPSAPAPADGQAPDEIGRRRDRAPIDRRAILAIAGAGVASAAGALWFVPGTLSEPPGEVRILIDRARASLREGTLDQTASAVSLLRRAVEIAPEHAESWGALSLAYQEQAIRSGSAAQPQIEARCRAAAARALALDPLNGDAMTALATIRTFYRRWSDYEKDCERVLAVHSNHPTLNRSYGHFLGHVGRWRSSLPHFTRAMATNVLSPQLGWQQVVALWSAGRLEEADAAIDRCISLWPRHYAVWFVRVRLLTHSNRAKAAMSMINEPDTRPTGVPDWNFDLNLKEARALDTRLPADIDAALTAYRDATEQGTGFAENAIVFAAATGRLDDAFAFARGYFFNRGFKVGEQRFAKEQGIQIAQRQRFSSFLFVPPVAPMRSDARFEPLVRDIGLEDYWRTGGIFPDYRTG